MDAMRMAMEMGMEMGMRVVVVNYFSENDFFRGEMGGFLGRRGHVRGRVWQYRSVPYYRVYLLSKQDGQTPRYIDYIPGENPQKRQNNNKE